MSNFIIKNRDLKDPQIKHYQNIANYEIVKK